MNKSKDELKEILAQLLSLSMEEGANLIKPEYTQDLYIEIEKMENPDSYISSFLSGSIFTTITPNSWNVGNLSLGQKILQSYFKGEKKFQEAITYLLEKYDTNIIQEKEILISVYWIFKANSIDLNNDKKEKKEKKMNHLLYPWFEDAEIYIKCLIVIAKADEYVHESEKEYIQMQSEIFGINSEELWKENLSVDDFDFTHISTLAKISILRDLIVIAYIDGRYDPREKDKIEQYAVRMSIEKKALYNLEDWCHRYFNLIQESVKFFEME